MLYHISQLSIAIRAKNRELLDNEDGDSDAEIEMLGPARKRNKTSDRRVLSDDEEEMAAGLSSIRAMASAGARQVPKQGEQEEEEREVEQTSDQDDDGQAGASRGEDEEDPELLEDLEGIDVDEADVDMDLGSGGGNLSNEVSYHYFFSSVPSHRRLDQC